MSGIKPSSAALLTLVLVALGLVGYLLFSTRPQAPEDVPSVANSVTPEFPAPAASTELAPAPPAVSSDRARADQLREALATLHAGRLQRDAGAPASDFRERRPEVQRYVADVMTEHVGPIVGGCYEVLLERSPGVGGKLQLDVSLMGAPELAGVVVSSKLRGTAGLVDPAFESCVSESLDALVLPSTPVGHPIVTVSQEMELEP